MFVLNELRHCDELAYPPPSFEFQQQLGQVLVALPAQCALSTMSG
jgi:hypothetical protein